jgi:pyruvate formate-lyase/glycerol dehydratase family glycyl radical enzyme
MNVTTVQDPGIGLKDKIFIKAVRNIRRNYEEDEEERGAYRPGVKLDLVRSRLVTESYKQTEGEPVWIRIARATEHILMNMPIYIRDWELIVGSYAEPDRVFYVIEQNWASPWRAVNSAGGKDLLNDEEKAEFKEMVDYWKGKTLSDMHQKFATKELAETFKFDGTALVTLWSDGAVPNYDKILKVGLDGFKKQAEERLEEIGRTLPFDYLDQKAFLEGTIISLDAAVKFAERYSEEAKRLAKIEKNKKRKKELEQISKYCAWVPRNPARTFWEALQSVYFVHLIRSQVEYTGTGMGARLDVLLNPYYVKDKEEGRITREEAVRLLEHWNVRLEEHSYLYSPTLSAMYAGHQTIQATTIGGVDENGKDVTSEVTYMVLEAAKAVRATQGCLSIRVHDGTPRELIMKALDVVKTGIGYPAFLNDKAWIPMFLKWGVPLEDARNYQVRGCIYQGIAGKNINRQVATYAMLPKCLWWALHQGVDPKTGYQRGARTQDPCTFQNIEDVMEAFMQQTEHFITGAVRWANYSKGVYARYMPRVFLSALIDGCIERGQDMLRWKEPYGSMGFITTTGGINVANSLAAMKKFVFEEKKISMAKLIEVLNNNWEGHEDLRQLFINGAPKYGNNDDDVDSIALQLYRRLEALYEKQKDHLGSPYHGDGSTLSTNYGLALDTPATPDGRKDGETFADGTLSPVTGTDSAGPTAVLLSASKISALDTFNHLLNQKFLPQFLEGPNKEKFAGYLGAWLDLGIAHIQFNVVDKATLVDAQKHPEKHPNLIVRVAGYSAYFNDLSRGMQDHIIARSEQAFA